MSNTHLPTDTPRIVVEVDLEGNVSVSSDTPVRVMVLSHKDLTAYQVTSVERALLQVGKEPHSNTVDEAMVNRVWSHAK